MGSDSLIRKLPNPNQPKTQLKLMLHRELTTLIRENAINKMVNPLKPVVGE